ncbi:MAG: LON peptidase substrate-binding domain-containing protein [Cyanobacteria bacterium SZAS LIN-3]|nr:LON peptidase substrate-binding domain-containing protein [Cyanobacteria bacterium SZAS LIN-3]
MVAKKKIILPLFPLPDVVLFPGCPLPLHIFEPRYRQMVNTLMEGDKTFGVLLYDPQTSQAASIGSTAEILECEKLPDGRMNIFTLGRRRFRVLRTIDDKPYLQGEIEWLEDQPADSDLKPITREVLEYIRDILRLSSKLTERDVDMPDDLPTDPIDLSYWVAATMYSVAEEKQALLESQDTLARLNNEARVLQVTTKFLAARSALKDAVG